MEDVFNRIVELRKKIGMEISADIVRRFWGQDYTKRDYVSSRLRNVNIGAYKLRLLQDNLEMFKSKYLRFIGVSGSIAAGTVNESDDIDIFVVVKNYTSWIYRLIVTWRLKKRELVMDHSLVAKKRSQKDKFCLNFIVEERALKFEPTVLNLHELIHLLPVYSVTSSKSDYFDGILMHNSWIMDKFGLKLPDNSEDRIPNSRSHLESIILWPFNFISFLVQAVIMILHGGDLRKILQWWSSGKIAIYETSPNYRSDV
ncbi:hypothetical protein GF357_01230 [Candidatus Dojkabacteria bacterium]|nr:hypothetical protein [Candidatus Dojkabacteria bacterium]